MPNAFHIRVVPSRQLLTRPSQTPSLLLLSLPNLEQMYIIRKYVMLTSSFRVLSLRSCDHQILKKLTCSRGSFIFSKPHGSYVLTPWNSISTLCVIMFHWSRLPSNSKETALGHQNLSPTCQWLYILCKPLLWPLPNYSQCLCQKQYRP